MDLLKQEFKKELSQARKVLDLGCGEGEIAKEVFGRRVEWGLDNDKKMVKKAKKSGRYKQVIWAGAEKMPLKNGEVDLVFSNSVLEHIFHLKQVLKEVSRVLKKDGLLIATMPSDKLVEYIGWGRLYGWWFNQKYSHYHLYSKDKWRKFLQKAGLELVDSYYYLDRPIIRQWHKLLWLNKLGLKGKVKTGKVRRLSQGAGIAIKVRKK